MSYRIQRENATTYSVVATNSASTTPKIAFATMSGGTIFVTAVSSATKVVWYASPDSQTTPVPLKDSTGSAVETTVSAGNAYALPDAVFGALFISAVADAGTVTMHISTKG